jgi:hypothetical protein
MSNSIATRCCWPRACHARAISTPATATLSRAPAPRCNCIPAFSDPASDDTRAIGVAIAGLWLDGAPVALDGTAPRTGWHPVEAGWRWTDGDAVLATDGAVVLEVSIAMTGRYWLKSCLPPERRAIA